MAHRSRRGFVAYYRRYTKTWVHALATAGLTAFGMLTFVHRGFAVVALAVYVVPPIVLYLRSSDAVAVVDSDGESRGNSATEAARDERKETADERSPPRWTAVESPTDAALFDAVVTDASGYAVGEGGVVVADGVDHGNGGRGTETRWHIALPDGPGADGRDLRGVDATGDGSAVWVAGDGGALGRIDAETGRHADHSAPSGVTDSWTDVAVAGSGGDETLLLVNGSGELLRGRYRDGEVAWAGPTKPGGGSSFCAATLLDAEVGYLCDTNDGVYEIDDGGETVRRVGIESADGTLTDVAANALGDCAVTDDAGVCYEYDGSNWTPTRVGDAALWALALRGEQRVAAGDGGTVYQRTDGTADWERVVTSAVGALRGVTLGDGDAPNPDRALAVGDDGAIVERRSVARKR